MITNVLIISLAVLISLSLLVLFGSYIAYRRAFYNNPKKNRVDPYRHIKNDGTPEDEKSRTLIENVQKLPYRDVFTTSHDGLRLHAKFFSCGNVSAPVAIQMHGYKSHPYIDFSGGCPLALKMGFDVIAVSQRACGESEGRTLTFGENESRDALRWIEYVRENLGADRKIILFGVSMGAATVIMAAGRGLPESVHGVVADCPCSSAKDIVIRVANKMGLPGIYLYPLARLGGILFGNFDPNRAEPREFVKNSKVPILLIHGEGDTFVPADMSREIAAASRAVELHIFPDAPHGQSFIYDEERYTALLNEFCNRCLSDSKNA